MSVQESTPPTPPTPVLPSGYQLVEWIKSTTNTGQISISFASALTLAADRKIRVGFIQDSANTSNEAVLAIFKNGSTTYMELFHNQNNAFISYCGAGSTSGYFFCTDHVGKKIDAEFTYSTTSPTTVTEAKADGQSITTYNATGTNKTGSITNIYIFCINGNSSFHSSSKLCYLEFLNNGVDIIKLYPCYRKSDNVIGLYDLARDKFITGTGTYTKGADVA